jgi:GT2 family glycosyltransferase
VSEHPSVSVVILSYDGRGLLETILPTLAAQTRPAEEILVVDNGSSDDSRAYLAAEWPQVGVVAIANNVGVAAALNRGVQAAGGELVALLNNDIELAPDWIEQMCAAAARHPDAGSIACKLRNYYRRQELDGAGDVLHYSGAATKRGHGRPDDGRFDSEDRVLAPTGGAGLYRSEAMREVGGFDESFYAYFEDVDWGLRAQAAGFECWYQPLAVGYHMEGRTTGGTRNPSYYSLQWRNSVGVMVKNLPARWFARHLAAIARHHAAGLVASARQRMLIAHLRGLLAVLPVLPRWLRERRRLSARRRLAAAAFERAIVAGGGRP